MTRTFGLPKSARLKSRKIISRLFSQGQHVFHYPFKLVYLYIEDTDAAEKVKMGVSISKKRFKSAVQRNLVKRRTREAYRINRHKYFDKTGMGEGWYAIMLIYVGNKIESFDLIEASMNRVLKKMKDAVAHKS